MKKIINNLKYIKITDILSIFIFILMIIPSLIFKLILKIQKRRVWVICEDGNTARDNGYNLFKYIRENHSSDETYYVINKQSNDYKKVEKLGNIIQYKSLKHWLYYMACDRNISSQKSGNPNAPIFYVLHVYMHLYNNRIFLQHGVIKDDIECLHYKNTKFKLFICGAKKEFEYIKQKYGYPKNYLAYTGLPRFDNLYNYKINKKQILIMPTWRNWLGRETNALGNKIDFMDTLYYKKWNSLINNKNLIEFIEKNDIKIIFYPHIHMQKYLINFKSTSKNIEIAGLERDIQELLKESSLLITDYSSVYMDFAYMSKPVIYYQFDYNEYREKQLQEGYFKYSKNAFGKILSDEDDVVSRIIGYVNMDYKVENIYLNRINEFFELKDQDNCKRVYESIEKI